MKEAGSIPARESTYGLKRRIQGIIQKIEVLAGELVEIRDELEIPDLREAEAMCEGRRQWSYEALLLGLLGLMDFYLAEVTGTRWRQSYAKHPPSKFKGEIYDPFLIRALRKEINRREEARSGSRRTVKDHEGNSRRRLRIDHRTGRTSLPA